MIKRSVGSARFPAFFHKAFDANPEWLPNDFIVSRHLDDKAGVAAVLAALKAVIDAGVPVPMDCHAVFTLTEEVRSGARRRTASPSR